MTDDVRHCLLDESLLSVGDATGRRVGMLSLPELYAALVRGAVSDFPALRPHQRHVWHAFLVQVGALALHRAGIAELPDDAAEWRELLLALTPDDPDGAAWALVAPHERPALLQPPVPGGDVSKFNSVATPDELDILIANKNHDIKIGYMRSAQPEHWLFALVSAQTQSGYSGPTWYGVSRMNGRSATRPGVGVDTEQNLGARVVRDCRLLLAARDRIAEDHEYPRADGIGLLWLTPWDGRSALNKSQLDPFFVEVCRRIRLVSDPQGGEGSLKARAIGSAKERVAMKAFHGNVGDPWTPLARDGAQYKAVTPSVDTFGYKKLAPILFPSSADPKAPRRALLQLCYPSDPDRGISVLIRAVVRGQGETQGFRERRIPISKTLRPFLGPEVATDLAARVASERVEDGGLFAKRVLYPAFIVVYTATSRVGEMTREDDTAKARARNALARFDAAVDATFFADLEAELAHAADPDARESARGNWLLQLRDLGRHVLDDVLASAPTAAMRHYRTRTRAHSRFAVAFHRQFGHRLPDAAASRRTREPRDPLHD